MFAGLSGYGAANGKLNPVRKTGKRRKEEVKENDEK